MEHLRVLLVLCLVLITLVLLIVVLWQRLHAMLIHREIAALARVMRSHGQISPAPLHCACCRRFRRVIEYAYGDLQQTAYVCTACERRLQAHLEQASSHEEREKQPRGATRPVSARRIRRLPAMRETARWR